MRFLPFVVALSASLVSGAAIETRQTATATQVYKFASPVSAEGIAVRSNGQILVSFFDKGELWVIDPAAKAATKAATFTDCTCSAGIAEIAPDVFGVVAGQYSGGNKPGSWGVWKVDFTSGTAKTSLIKKVPESGMWNGLTAFSNDTVLIGDATKGAVWRMNVNTGDYSIAIQDTTMAQGSGGIPMGIDGLRYFNGTVYFTNISKNTFIKVPVDATGKATGSFTPIWSNSQADDLWITSDGTAYVAGSNKIQKVSTDGKASTFATTQGSTACTIGKGDNAGTLYVAQNNGVISSVKLA